jgi:hypothetical protein
MATSEKLQAKHAMGSLLAYEIDYDGSPVAPFLAAGELITAVEVTSLDAEIIIGDGATTYSGVSGSQTPPAPTIIDSSTAIRFFMWDSGAVDGETYQVDVRVITNGTGQPNYSRTVLVTAVDN